jgi:hypothetical protein
VTSRYSFDLQTVPQWIKEIFSRETQLRRLAQKSQTLTSLATISVRALQLRLPKSSLFAKGRQLVKQSIVDHRVA